ncbi:hypothetical protein [uncultured Marivita sp.]|uniref:hypothetical protein n=1 Tax=uncultured Marivita sp. TaxID=888080 RepID=UPI00262451C6|nr:hypothetical protein [uncultured Marivita sp.]
MAEHSSDTGRGAPTESDKTTVLGWAPVRPGAMSGAIFERAPMLAQANLTGLEFATDGQPVRDEQPAEADIVTGR